MALKRLELFGFKTFADRTELEFPDGVTAVVGPNGSGKSNIADAILWALGESNIRHLRGERAHDVIFAGTTGRRPIGMAEASLTFSNEDGRLPLDEPEVTVTRRVYRSGEAEFFINRRPCRLKDIQDLFLDTGVGRGAYSMVGQSEIDAILSARPEDRRVLFEEAAGIKKYRVRKTEALRHLEATEANLTRVTDILAEIERQAGPMERAAEVAARFRGLDARRLEIERYLFAFDIRRLQGELESVSGQAAALEREVEQARTDRATAEADEAAIRLETTRLERELDEARSRAEELRLERARLEAEQKAAVARQTEAERREADIEETLQGLTARMRDAEARQAAAQEQAQTLESQLADLQARVADARAASDAERANLQALGERLSALRAEQVRLQTAIAARTTEARSARAEAERLGPAVERMTERLAELRAQREASEREAAEAVARHDALTGVRDESSAALAALEGERAAVSAAISEKEAAIAAARRETADRAGRLRVLAEMQEHHEGFFAGVRAVLEAARKGRLPAVYEAADAMTVPPGLEVAIESALGGQLQDIICPTSEDAKAAIALLKEDNAGRATFLPLDLISPGARVSVPETPGIVGWAVELVRFDERLAPAMEYLLGRVLIVRDLDIAVRVVRGRNLPLRAVSLDGELVTGQGVMTGGRGKGSQTHLLGRKREMKDISDEVEALESSVRTMQEEADALRERLASVNQAVKTTARTLEETRMALAEAVRKRQYAENTSQRLQREAEATEQEARAARDRLAQVAAQAEALETAAAGAREHLAPLEAQAAAMEQALASPDTARGETLTALEVELAAVRERQHAAVAEAARAAETIASAAEEAARRNAQRDESRRVAAEAAAAAERLGNEIAALNARETEAAARMESCRQRRDEQLQQAAGCRERAHEAEERGARAAERLRKLEVRAAQIRSERLHLLTRLDQLLGASEPVVSDEEADAESPGQDWDDDRVNSLLAQVTLPDPFSRHSAVVEWNRLKREIADLGPVNLAAEREFVELRERRDFMRIQHDDLVNADEKLRRTIRDIDESTRQTFLETFHEVEQTFARMFHRLFGGGVTRLVLTEPDNLLETGIEVIVQPPGKKLQNLQLLSGGERALTAAALIFSFLSVRPSPFVVMDEVDAPLDEANVGRFAALLREFSKASQFVVITHNRGTMEQCDAIYGVSMQEPGVSRVISLRLEDKPGANGTGGPASADRAAQPTATPA
jgi:chromosome segregation protein